MEGEGDEIQRPWVSPRRGVQASQVMAVHVPPVIRWADHDLVESWKAKVVITLEVTVPLVLTSNDANVSGHTYEDITGVSYEYPTRYRNIIAPGERFIYYRGRQLPGGGRQPQVYFGTGVVGRVRQSLKDTQTLVCEILDYRPFGAPVYFKDQDGNYLEVAGSRPGYFQPGVRRISEEEFNNILEAARLAASNLDVATTIVDNVSDDTYAAPNTSQDIEGYAIQTAVDYLIERFPDLPVEVLHHSNPGYDIRVGTSADIHRYVEVKGTQSPQPRFYLSEGERLFSEQNADRYLLLVVYDIDLDRGQHRLIVHEGVISDKCFVLEPLQWIGTLKETRSSS